jgi:hypothetical protein
MYGSSSYYSSFDFSESIGVSNYVLWPAIIFTVLLIILCILLFRNRTPGITDYMSSMVELNKATYPVGSNETHSILFTGSGCTLAGLFNVTIGDRTNQINTAVSTNFTTLFGSVGSIEFQLAPAGASATDSNAQLLIGTQSGIPEVVPLPSLPAQKWIFIAILRDGRRFDVLYNDSIVASHRLTSYPGTSVQNKIQVGADPSSPTAPPRFLGNAVHLFALNYRMSPADLAVLRAKYVDTTGGPPTPLPFPFPIDLLSLQTLCIPGLPCKPVNQPPPNHLQAWSSPYA